MAASKPLRIGGPMSEHLADHGNTEIPLSLELLSDGEPTTHVLTGDMLAGMLGVHSTSQLNVTGIEVKGSHSDFDGNLAVSMHQVDPDDPTVMHPLPNTSRHMFAKSVGDSTALIAAHAIVSKGSVTSNIHHKFDDRIPHKGPQFSSSLVDAGLAAKKDQWRNHYGTNSDALLSAPGITSAQRDGKIRAAISLNSAYAEDSALCALAQKHQNNPDVLRTIFAGSSGEPVPLVNIKTGVEEPHIVCEMASVQNAADHLSTNLQHPYLHKGLAIKTHVASGVPTKDANATLHVTIHRQTGAIGGETVDGPITKHAVDSAAGKEIATPAEILSATAAKAKFAAGLFDAPISSTKAPATVVPNILEPTPPVNREVSAMADSDGDFAQDE